MDGILLIDKPADWTSHDVVAKTRGIIEKELREQAGEKRRAKVGHAGTLDPFATGLLILLIGKGTKQAQNLLKLDKTYEVEIVLGATSDTDDREGKIQKSEAGSPQEEAVFKALEKFNGQISQTPPQFSAIKKGGQRAYKVARKGEHIELEPRDVTVYSIEQVNYEWPRLSFTTSVSSGTYIRSLARDIGEELGVGGYVDVLRRTQIADYNVNASTQITQLNYNLIQKQLLPLD